MISVEVTVPKFTAFINGSSTVILNLLPGKLPSTINLSVAAT